MRFVDCLKEIKDPANQRLAGSLVAGGLGIVALLGLQSHGFLRSTQFSTEDNRRVIDGAGFKVLRSVSDPEIVTILREKALFNDAQGLDRGIQLVIDLCGSPGIKSRYSQGKEAIVLQVLNAEKCLEPK